MQYEKIVILSLNNIEKNGKKYRKAGGGWRSRSVKTTKIVDAMCYFELWPDIFATKIPPGGVSPNRNKKVQIWKETNKKNFTQQYNFPSKLSN